MSDKVIKFFPINFYAKVLGLGFLCMLIWWSLMMVSNVRNTTQNFLYELCLGILPLLGSFFGLMNARRWGSLRSTVGRAIIFLSAGLMTWGIGNFIFVYYEIFLKINVPYPSLADVGYIMSVPLWTIGMFFLFRISGVKYGLRSLRAKTLLLIVPLLIIIISYYILVVIARGGIIDFSSSGTLKLFFDLAYPIGDVIILTLSALIYSLSYKYLGGFYKKVIYIILVGFILMYFADFSFSYTTTSGTFYAGSWVDLLFMTALSVLSIGISIFEPAPLDKDMGS